MNNLEDSAKQTLTDAPIGAASDSDRPVCRCGAPRHATDSRKCANNHQWRGAAGLASKGDDPDAGKPVTTREGVVSRLQARKYHLLSGKVTSRTTREVRDIDQILQGMGAGLDSGTETRVGGTVARLMPASVLKTIEQHVKTHTALGMYLNEIPPVGDADFAIAASKFMKPADIDQLLLVIAPEPLRIEMTHTCHRCKATDPEYAMPTREQAGTRLPEHVNGKEGATKPARRGVVPAPVPPTPDVAELGHVVGPVLAVSNRPAPPKPASVSLFQRVESLL